jgi:serine protease Do
MNKKIISLLLAIALSVSLILSLSSCMGMLEAMVEYGETQGANTPHSSDDKDTNNNNNTTPPASDKDTQGSGSSPEFYPSTGGGDVEEEDVSLTSRALLSVVSVYAAFKVEYGYPSYTTETLRSRGSGVIYKLDRESGDAYIITNYHVVYHQNANTQNHISDDIEVFLYGQEYEQYAIKAKYVGGSMNNDIALLKVTGSEVLKNSSAIGVTVADSDSVTVFDKVYVIGNPEGYGISVTEGIISVDSEPLSMTAADGKTTITPRVFRVSAAINDGNSGGGLFDSAGQLIGIVNAKRQGMSVDNIGYAIPTNVAARLAESIIDFCDGETNTTPLKAMIGVEISAPVTGVTIDENGRVIRVEISEITEVYAGAAVTGLIEVGDRINSITVDGLTKQTTRRFQILDMMFFARVGSVVTLNVTRGGETFDVSYTVTAAMFARV